MHLLAPSILQKLKILRTDPELQPKIGQFVLNKLFLVQTIIITFIFLLALFILQNLKQILTLDPELWECAFFGPKMVHLPQTKFVWKIINIILIYLLAPFFNCAKVYKNSSRGSRVLRMHNFWAQNGPFPQIRIFSENLLMSLVSFIHAYLHAKNQSQIFIY